MKNKKINKKDIIYYILSFFNRFAHWFDVIIIYFVTDYLYNTQFSNSNGLVKVLIYIPLIVQIIWSIKYEYLVFKSKSICNELLLNGRVMAFCGAQGRGKSSFACFLASNKRFKNVYTNTPIKIRRKWVNMLESDILTLDSKVDDFSLFYIDEATLFYHNLKTKENLSKSSQIKDEIYSQEVLTQCVRHFFDGNIFYISTDCNRLPAPIKENISVTNLMLGQNSKCISFIVGNFVVFVAKILGYEFYNGLRYWEFQQFEKIPDLNYTFDLSNQVKDTDLKQYSNLIKVYTFNNPNLFDYNDRFLYGLYKELPEHINNKWSTFDFDTQLLVNIGYGAIVDFFESKKRGEGK